MSWQRQALCREVGSALHDDPDYNEGGAFQMRVADAKAVCDLCEVRAECLRFALEMEAGQPFDDRQGVWGGLTARERTALDPSVTAAA